MYNKRNIVIFGGFWRMERVIAMKYSVRRLVSWILALAMLAGLCPAFSSTANTESIEEETPQAEIQTVEQECIEELPAPDPVLFEEIPQEIASPAVEESVPEPEYEQEQAAVEADEAEVTEEDISAAPMYSWQALSDDAFFAFLQQGEYASLKGDTEAEEALLLRAQQIQEPGMRDSALEILNAWLNTAAEDETSPAEEADSVPESDTDLPIPDEEEPGQDDVISSDGQEVMDMPLDETDAIEVEPEEALPAEDSEILEFLPDEITEDAGVYNVTLGEINGDDMFFKQEIRGTCTLTASAMLIRRSARILGNPSWPSITESALRPYAWIEGTGMMWNFSYAGITVAHTAIEGWSLGNLAWMLQEHPEGFVAYNARKPHAVLITDITDGIVYCGDPGLYTQRMPLDQSVLSLGSQEETIAAFTAIWYVTSPKLSLTVAPTVPTLNEIPMTISAADNHDGTVTLNWNDAGAASYSVYRSASKDGPWTEVYQANSSTFSWTDTSTRLLHTYYYVVHSYSADRTMGVLSPAVGCTPDRGGNRIASGTCGADICWALYDDGMMLLSGSGAMGNYSAESEEPWFACRSQMKEVYISEGITAIGRSAFGGCTSLTKVVMPATVSVISDWAFRGCSLLQEVVFGGGITQIGYAAFRQCDSLQSITIPDTVTAIGDWAFSNCPALNQVVLPANLSAIGNSMFYEDALLATVAIPASVQTIGEHAFRSCKALRLAALPQQLRSVGKYAFAMCHGITSLDLSGCGGTLAIGEGAFYNCAYMVDLVLPTAEVGASAFAYCYSLTHVRTVGTGDLLTIGANAFLNCTRLGHVLTSGVVQADAASFSGDAAEILVDASCNGGDFTRTEGANLWRSYRYAGANGNSYWFVDETGCMILYGGTASAAGEWGGIAAQVNALQFENGIAGIASGAFASLTSVQDIYMPETAMAIDAEAFSGITAKVHYHNVNGSWTDVAGQNYGGTLTWQEVHTMTWAVEDEPDMETCGSILGTCVVCNATQTVELPKLDLEHYSFTPSDGVGTFVWNNQEYGLFSFTVPLLTITEQPVSAEFYQNTEAIFAVCAEGTDLTYQWQWRTKDTAPWNDSSAATKGYNTPELHPVAIGARNGYQYRCMITDAVGTTVYSEPATMTVRTEVILTAQPESVEIEENTTASFRVAAKGEGLSYRWQWRVSDDAAWSNCSSATAGYNTAELKPVATMARNGYQYRCMISDRYGDIAYSDSADLRVYSALQITLQPKDTYVTTGAAVSFQVEAKGNGLRYRWQYRTTAANAWANCSAATSGYNGTVLAPSATLGRNGYQYRCVITDQTGRTITSDEVTLFVSEGLRIVSQPNSQTVYPGEQANFAVSAVGTGLKYQWQYRTSAAASWANCSSATSGYRSAILAPVATNARNGYEYRCVITDAEGTKLTTDAAQLLVQTGPAILEQPSHVTAASGTSVVFAVKATGTGLSYRWQYCTPTGSWTNCSAATSGYNTNSLSPVATAGRNGYQYRCVITVSDGTKLTSNAATLTVR